jgi:ribosomal protein S18 acetylase RimI-like enzyme
MTPRGQPRVRTSTEDDIPGILACLAAAFEPYRPDYTAAAFLRTVLTPALARARRRSMAVFVAEDSSAGILGTLAAARASPTEGYLRGFAVLPDRQGTGVASHLLEHALEHLSVSGCRRVTLETTRPLVRAVRFYRKNGFRPSGKVTDFYGMPVHEYVREL